MRRTLLVAVTGIAFTHALTGPPTSFVVASAAQTDDGRRALIHAIQRDDRALVAPTIEAGVSANVKDDDGVPALMLATLFSDAAGVELLLKRGADPNLTDAAGATALMWAIPDLQKVRVLIDHGANVNARSTSGGRTALGIASAYPGTVEVLDLLLARGADLRAKDNAGFTALARALQSADIDVVRFLVEKGLDPKDELPAGALTAVYVRARPAILDFAMTRGLKVPRDILLRASNWQSPDWIRRWIDQGAETNGRGGPYSVTPLLAAASSEYAGADTLRILLEHGADPNVADAEGEKPLDWALYRADKGKIAILEKHGATRGGGPRAQLLPSRSGEITGARLSVDRSVSLLLKSSQGIFEGRRCFTCHHNSLPAEAVALARRKGLAVNEELEKKNVDDILATFRQAAGPSMQAQPTVPGGIALTVGYGLMALAAEGRPLDKAIAAMVHWVLATQMPDGSWLGNGVNRPPIESSTVSHTAIAARGLTLYPIPGYRAHLDRALAKTRQWLLSADTPTSEDRAMRLMGLVWTKAPASAIASAMQDVVRRQTAVGGWSQLSQLDPDAYATGLALVALHEAGMAVTDDVYRKGVRFLLNTQYPDGSWLVRTRSFPVQPYFESGFPFGRHQWISAAGTAWAARAIALTLPDAQSSRRNTEPPQPHQIVLTRVFPQPGQLGLFIAAADGAGERPLLAQGNIDYNAAWAPDGASIVFTSERNGSADLYRVKADGSGEVERLTDSPAYDDQAAYSPDGKRLVFVSTRTAGTADLWTLDLQTRRATGLTSGEGGDFRPSWSPDGRWIAFASDRLSDMPFAHGRWEHLQLANIYIIRPDGSGLKQLSPHRGFCGTPKWTADSRRLVAYCMTAEQTLDNRRAIPEHPEDTRLVSIDIASGSMADVTAGNGVKFNPSIVPGGVIAYIRRDGDARGIHYSDGRRGPAGDIRSAAWSPDGGTVVFHKRVTFQRKPWVSTWSRDPAFALTLTNGGPSFSPAGDRFAFVGPAEKAKGAGVAISEVGSETSRVIYRDPSRNILGPQWSPDGNHIVFGIGHFNAFFNGFRGLFLKREDRTEGGAQIAMVNADGSGFRELTRGPNNNGFPSMSPDGRRLVYRTFGPEGQGLRIMDITTTRVTSIGDGYDNFPLWSPRGDLIIFSRQDAGDYEIYSIKPDGTGLKRLTRAHGNDGHMAWSPDGEHIAFASSRMGFKDEVTYTDAPQPYGEIFVMRTDGSDVRQLTDNQWEEGTPAWRPLKKATTY